MTVPRRVADVLEDHRHLRARVHRPDVSQPLPAQAHVPLGRGRVLQAPPGHALRLRRPHGRHVQGQRPTPGRFRARVITEGVIPSIHLDYKRCRIKQYFKQGRALRTECTINDTRDFGIRRRLHNLPALREVGFPANRRLLGVQRISCDPTAGATAYDRVCRPVVVRYRRYATASFASTPSSTVSHDVPALLLEWPTPGHPPQR